MYLTQAISTKKKLHSNANYDLTNELYFSHRCHAIVPRSTNCVCLMAITKVKTIPRKRIDFSCACYTNWDSTRKTSTKISDQLFGKSLKLIEKFNSENYPKVSYLFINSSHLFLNEIDHRRSSVLIGF